MRPFFHQLFLGSLWTTMLSFTIRIQAEKPVFFLLVAHDVAICIGQ